MATRIRDREATEQRLIAAVGVLLAREGFEALGINAVARRAGVDKVLIYRYFDGMPGLLRAFGRSEAFWPSVDEVIGEGSSDLRKLPPADRWATGLSRYARALRRRKVAREIIAWEQVEKNELTEILREIREEWFTELLGALPDDPVATDADLTAGMLFIVAGIHFLVARSRLHADFSGMAIDTDEGWDHIDGIILTMCRRTFRESDHHAS